MTNRMMLSLVGLVATAGICMFSGCGSDNSADASPVKAVKNAAKATTPAKPGVGMTAMRDAAQANKYLFALFHKKAGSQTSAMRSVVQAAVQEAKDRATMVEVDAASTSEKDIIDKFGLDRAPMPLVLAIAPNGAITGGFPVKAEKKELLDSFVSPALAKCLKPLQENKLVFLCVQNKATESNEAALKGVNEFKNAAEYAGAVATVTLDPTDAAEADFLKDLQIDPKIKTAVTVFLAPPGTPIAMYEGATSKDDIVATLKKAQSSSCCPGGSCGPGGCGPAK